jgi:Beta-eliminating lyase
VLFTYGGTGSTVIALQSLLSSHEAVICPATAHLNVDERGAPERFSGAKLIVIPSSDGKLHAYSIHELLRPARGEHNVNPKPLAISQVTERGTIYSLDEIAELGQLPRANGQLLHMDGGQVRVVLRVNPDDPEAIAAACRSAGRTRRAPVRSPCRLARKTGRSGRASVTAVTPGTKEKLAPHRAGARKPKHPKIRPLQRPSSAAARTLPRPASLQSVWSRSGPTLRTAIGSSTKSDTNSSTVCAAAGR